ncbi:MAG: hypothetical protein AB4060_22575 [Crocosphaera sp.]
MEFSERGFVEHNQSNALDLSYETVIQRHNRQKWQYQYPRHIRPHFSSLSKQEKITNYLLESQVIIPQVSEGKICPISAKPTEKLTVNEVDKIHLQNLCLNLERRLKNAKFKRDEWLISFLEKKVEQVGELCII